MEMHDAKAVQVHMDYLDRSGIRTIRVNLEDETIEADLLNGRLTVNGSVSDYPSERDFSYRAMHQAALAGTEPGLVSTP